MSLLYLLLFGLGLLVPAAVLTAAVLYIKRSWDQIRAEGDGSVQHRILDQVESLDYQLQMTNERLVSCHACSVVI